MCHKDDASLIFMMYPWMVLGFISLLAIEINMSLASELWHSLTVETRDSRDQPPTFSIRCFFILSLQNFLNTFNVIVI